MNAAIMRKLPQAAEQRFSELHEEVKDVFEEMFAKDGGAWVCQPYLVIS